MTILRDPVWQFIGAVLAILVPIVAWWFGTRKQEKSLSYEVSTFLSLLRIGKEVKNQIKILYQDRIVGDLYVIVIKLCNDGRKPILRSEFTEPVQILLPKGFNLLSAEVIETTPAELKPRIKFSVEPEKTIITPTLLNQGDTLTIKMLAEDKETFKMLAEDKETLFEILQPASEITVDGRIEGVRKINRKDSFSALQKLREEPFPLPVWVLLIALTISPNIFTYVTSSTDDKKWAQIILVSTITSAIGYLIGKSKTNS